MGVAGGLESVYKTMPLGPRSAHGGSESWAGRQPLGCVRRALSPLAGVPRLRSMTFPFMKRLKSSTDRPCHWCVLLRDFLFYFLFF